VGEQSRRGHWDAVYRRKAVSDVSWYEARPLKSLELIRAAGPARDAAILDVGGGTSTLVDELLAAGYRDVTVLDVSAAALQQVRVRLGARAAQVQLLEQDVTQFSPPRGYALWHDRAVFHFLTEPGERERYVDVLRRALPPPGQVIISGFGPEGPLKCSGLPVARYDAVALARELGADFALIESALSVHHTPAHVTQQFVHCRLRRVA